jgi:hypothetical protein
LLSAEAFLRLFFAVSRRFKWVLGRMSQGIFGEAGRFEAGRSEAGRLEAGRLEAGRLEAGR